MVALERIQVKGFKSIREMDLELRPLNVLIGANGSGKSNFLEVFRLLNQIVEERLQYYVAKEAGANRLLHFGSKTTSEIELKLQFNNGLYYEVRLATAQGDRLIIAEEKWGQGGVDFKYNGHPETKLLAMREPPFDELVKIFKSWRIYHFHDTSDRAKIRLTGNIHDNEFLRSDASNLAAYLYLMNKLHPNHYRRIVKTMQMIMPFVEDFDLHPVAENQDTIMLAWREKGFGESLKAHVLSDGSLRFMALTTLLMQPNLPPLLLIDEPELGLHPYAVNLMLEMIESAAVSTQVIVATQLTKVVDQLAPQDTIVVNRDEKASTFKRFSEQEIEHWLAEYSLGELWEKNVLGGTP